MKSTYNLEYFSEKDWSFVLIKKDKIIYSSKLQGLKPLIFCIKKYRQGMPESIVFDKIVGHAAAILLAYAKVKEVWTPTVSKAGKEYLGKKKVKLAYKNEILRVMNRQGNDPCPMEKMCSEMAENEFIEKMLGS